MKKLVLAHAEATPEQLKAALGSTQEYRKRIRLLALLKFQEGKPVSAIAEFFGVHPTTLPRWVNRVNTEGLAGLNEKPGRGRPGWLTDAQRDTVRDHLQHPPKDYGLVGTLWTGKLLRAHIQREFSVTYGERFTAMYTLLHDLGFSLQRPTKHCLGANPDKQAKFKAVVKKNLAHGQG